MNILNPNPMLKDLDLQKELTFDEVKHFLSKCDEFEVSEHDNVGTLKISLKWFIQCDYDENNKPINKKYAHVSSCIYKPTIQTLLRHITNLGYLHHTAITN